VPIKSSTMDGLDSLLSIVQMPSGIPVATVAIDGAEMLLACGSDIVNCLQGSQGQNEGI